ncbi:MAG: putative toxin-antitoxin system toxin component, PIN family [Shackletoniella antarctica]|uniref:Putative toxin-antitoxin system toxin component, PIN family n=1 Tax=Shackletoniella antarctica TaxID=268115 RepID=A0A2W4WEA7_9CYAN|nr:MAG: putative toxin-antitoxin system toxin component, PIN family [Shackletoniella antarctica]
MKVVIDTNVLVSAVLRDRDPEAVILFVLEQDDFTWVVSDAILTEYRNVLARKRLGISDLIQQRWLKLIGPLTSIVSVDQTISFPRDPKDAKFLACALSARAEFLITGDRDFSEARRLVSTKILSISQFKRLVCDNYP